MPSTHGNTNKCCCCCCCKVKVYTVTKTEISHLYNDVIFSFIFVLTVSIETGLTLLHKSEGQLQSVFDLICEQVERKAMLHKMICNDDF